MKNIGFLVIRLFICLTIGWFLSSFIEDKTNLITWGIPGIIFFAMFSIFSFRSIYNKPIIKWMGGALFISLPVLTIIYLIVYCCNMEAYPLLWEKWMRIIFAFVAGELFIFGGKVI